MAILRLLLAGGAVVLLSACRHDPLAEVELRESTSLHAVLRAGSDTAAVLLLRYDPRSAEPFQRLSGADVAISSAGELARLREAPEGFRDCVRSRDVFLPDPAIRSGCYAARLPGPIRSGESYRLRVALPGGDSVTGAVVVPAAPVIVSPAEGLVIRTPPPGQLLVPPSSRFTAKWTVPKDVARIEVGLVTSAVFWQGRRLAGAACIVSAGFPEEDHTSADSLVYSIGQVGCQRGSEPVQWDSLAVRLVVTAYDTAYARYAAEVLSNGSVRGGRASAGIQGAFGVFAGAASDERHLVLHRTP